MCRNSHHWSIFIIFTDLLRTRRLCIISFISDRPWQMAVKPMAWAFTLLSGRELNRAGPEWNVQTCPALAPRMSRRGLKAANSLQRALTGHFASQVPRIRLKNFIRQLKHNEVPARIRNDLYPACTREARREPSVTQNQGPVVRRSISAVGASWFRIAWYRLCHAARIAIT